MKNELKILLNNLKIEGNYNSDEFNDFTLWIDGILPIEQKEDLFFNKCEVKK